MVPAFALVFVLFCALAVAKTFPLVLHATTHLPIYGDSPYHVGWILAWGAHALVTQPGRLFEANLMYPLEHSLAFSDHMLGAQPIFAPLYFLTGNPTLAYNVLFIATFALTAFAACCLAWSWTGALGPSVVAGVLVGFAPVRLGHIHHLHVLVLCWAPLVLLFLHRVLQTGRWRDLAAFAGWFLLQALSSVYAGFLAAAGVVLYVGVYIAAIDRTVLNRAMAVKALAFAGAGLAVLVPVHLPYLWVRNAWGSPWTTGTLAGGSADARSFLSAPFLMNDAYLGLSRAVQPVLEDDKLLFPGLVLPALALLGVLVPPRDLPPARARQARLLFGIVTLAALVLALGPSLTVWGHKTSIPLPYLLLQYVPGWSVTRIPARFVLLAVVAAGPLAALGAMRLTELARDRRWGRAAVSAALIGLFLVELGGKPLPLDATPTTPLPETYRWLAWERPGPVLEVPVTDPPGMRYLYLSTAHWLPVLGPISSFAPGAYLELRDALAELPSPRAVQQAAVLGVAALVVHGDRLSAEARARFAAQIGRSDDLRPVASFSTDSVFALRPVAATSRLTASLAAPSWLPADSVVRLGLRLSGTDERAWAHPAPQGQSAVRVEWLDADGGLVAARTVGVELPLAIAGGETAQVPVRVRTPGRPGRYRLRLSVVRPDLRPEPVPVDVRASQPPTSAAGDGLRASYDAVVPSTVVALGFVPLRVTALNTGTAVWLAKALHNRGEVALRWRWQRQGGAPGGLGGRARVRYDVFPGQAHVFDVWAATPAEPGRYVLELDLSSEGVRSFAERGTPPLSVTVEVTP